MNKLLPITTIVVLSGVVFCSFFPVSAQAGELYGVLSFSTGAVFTDNEFDRAFDLNERTEIGVMCEAAKPSWPVAMVAGYSLSYGHSKTIDIFCIETRLGIKKTLDLKLFVKPYISGGFNSLRVFVDSSHNDESKGDYGIWYGAGLRFKITETWCMNLGWRRSSIKLKLSGKRLDAGGDHFDWSIGYCFPQSK